MVLFTSSIFERLYQCHTHEGSDNIDSIISKLTLDIDTLISSNDDELPATITNSNNIVHSNVLLKEIFDTLWISLGLAGYIVNDNNNNNNNDNYVLSKEGFYYFYESYFHSIFTDSILNTSGVLESLMKIVDNKWQCMSAYFNNRDRDVISSVNIFIFYHIVFEAADIVFMFLQQRFHPSFLWILLNNIVDVNIDGGRCRTISSIGCILSVTYLQSLSLSLSPSKHEMAVEYETNINKLKQLMQVQVVDDDDGDDDYNSSPKIRRPTTASDTLSRSSGSRGFVNEKQHQSNGMSFRSFLKNDRHASTRPSSASIAIVPTVIKSTQHDTIGVTKWKQLQNLLKQREEVLESGNPLTTTLLEDWKPIISSLLMADYERQRMWKTGSLSRPQSPEQNEGSGPSFSPIKRPKSSVVERARPKSGRPIKEEIHSRPKSSPSASNSARPKSSAGKREKTVLVEYGNPDFDGEIAGERKPVYKIVETKVENDVDGDSLSNIESITDKLMASTSDSMHLEKSIELNVKNVNFHVYDKLSSAQMVSVEEFLFKPETFYLNQPRSPTSPTAAELPHFASFLTEQQQNEIKTASPIQNTTIDNSATNQESEVVTHAIHSATINLKPLSAKRSDHSILKNLSVDVEGGLSLGFVPSPSMYSNAMIDANFSLTDNNELFSPHGGSYLETNVDPAMKLSRTGSISLNEDSGLATGKYKLEDSVYVSDDQFVLEISGKGSPIPSKDKSKKFIDDYGSITDSSRGSPVPISPTYRRLLSDANLEMLDSTMGDIRNLDDVDQHSISPVSSVVVKMVDSKKDDKNDAIVMGSSYSVNTVNALLQTNTLLSRSNLAMAPVAIEELGRSLNIPIAVQSRDVIIDTSLCIKKELKHRQAKSPSLVTKLRNNIKSKNDGIIVDSNPVSSKFLNDPKYPKINLTSSRLPWGKVSYNPYIDPLLNGAPMTWEERRLSQTWLHGDINHMVIDVKKQSASRAAFEEFAESKTPTFVKYKKYNRKQPKGLFGLKKPLSNPTKRQPPESKPKEIQVKPVVKESDDAHTTIKRRSAFIRTRENTEISDQVKLNLLIPRVFQ